LSRNGGVMTNVPENHGARASATKLPAVKRDAPRQKSEASSYNRVVAVAALRSIRLVTANFFLEVMEAKEERFNNPSWSCPMQDFDREKGTLFSLHKWTVAVDAGKPMKAEISATFLIVYDGLTDEDEAAVSRLIDRVGKFSSYPYFRAHVATSASMAGINVPPLELLKDNLLR